MAEEEKKEQEGEKKEKKKGNGFTNFFKKVGKSISDSNRESKIESTFRKEEGVKEYEIYTGNGLLAGSKSVYGKFDADKNEVVVFGEIKEEDVPYSSVLSTIPENPDKELPKRYYVIGLKPETVDVEIEEDDPNDSDKKVKNTYNRPATRISLDPNVVEVDVIKVKDTYYVKQKKAK